MTGERNILILSPWNRLWSLGGGGTTSDADLIDGLLDAGYSITLVAPPLEGDEDFPTHQRLRVHRLGAAGRVRLPWGTAYQEWASLTWRLVREGLRVARTGQRPDLVYGLSSNATPAAAICGRRLGIPSVGKLYGTFLHPFIGNRWHLALRFPEVAAFKSPVTRLVIHNDGTRGDDVAARLRVPPERIRFWGGGVDREACDRAVDEADGGTVRRELGVAPESQLLYTASRLVNWKRVDRLIRAMPAVLEEHPRAVLAVAGGGTERDRLEALARELEVAHAVVFAGAVPREGNLRAMAACDVFGSFYDFSNVGHALLEALSCGAAVVVADTGATRAVVEDGVNGLVVAPDDTEAAARAISSLLRDPALRERLGAEARRLAAERLPTRAERARVEVEMVEELIGPAARLNS
jgi:glycosyltransferase involved in cell wall biosynthesis